MHFNPLDPKLSLDRLWHALNTTRDRAAASTVEALVLTLRAGTGALSRPDVLGRLDELDDQQLREVMVRLQKIVPAWTSEQMAVLAAISRRSRGR
jgi:hypothetical protein